MADIKLAENSLGAIGDDNPSPSQDDLATGNGAEARGTKRARMSTAGDDDDDDDEGKSRERRKIEIKFIQDKSRRHITFSKRKAGIMKKVSDAFQVTPSTPRMDVASSIANEQMLTRSIG